MSHYTRCLGRFASSDQRLEVSGRASAVEDWDANRASYRDWARNSGFGIVSVDPNEKSALETSAEEQVALRKR